MDLDPTGGDYGVGQSISYLLFSNVRLVYIYTARMVAHVSEQRLDLRNHQNGSVQISGHGGCAPVRPLTLDDRLPFVVRSSSEQLVNVAGIVNGTLTPPTAAPPAYYLLLQ